MYYKYHYQLITQEWQHIEIDIVAPSVGLYVHKTDIRRLHTPNPRTLYQIGKNLNAIGHWGVWSVTSSGSTKISQNALLADAACLIGRLNIFFQAEDVTSRLRCLATQCSTRHQESKFILNSVSRTQMWPDLHLITIWITTTTITTTNRVLAWLPAHGNQEALHDKSQWLQKRSSNYTTAPCNAYC